MTSENGELHPRLYHWTSKVFSDHWWKGFVQTYNVFKCILRRLIRKMFLWHSPLTQFWHTSTCQNSIAWLDILIKNLLKHCRRVFLEGNLNEIWNWRFYIFIFFILRNQVSRLQEFISAIVSGIGFLCWFLSHPFETK